MESYRQTRWQPRVPRALWTLLILTSAAYCSSGGSGGPVAPGPEPPGSNNAVPVVTLSGETSVDADKPITVNVQATDADGLTRVVVAWGDGTEDMFEVGGGTSFERAATHTYARVGAFQVEATATDSRSAVGRSTRTITTRGGAVDIGLVLAPGSAPLIARASVSAGGTTVSVLDGDVVTASHLVPGDIELSAEAVHPDCAIEGDAVRQVRIVASSSVRVDFDISCSFVPEERIVYNTQASEGFDDTVSSVRPDGSDRRLLTDQDGLAFPAWSPDGSRILAGFLSLWIMNYDGTEATRIGEGSRPAWSPDGGRIAFELGGDIAVADFEGRRYTNVVLMTRDGDAVADEGPSWSPDGSTLVFHRGDVVHRIRADGSDLRALAPGLQAVWMPDGSRIVFKDSETAQIASMKPDGTDLKLLTDQGPTGHPDPSPTGQRIVFHSQGRLWTIAADGTDPRMIDAVPSSAGHANWGPP